MKVYDSRRLFHLLRKAVAANGLSYWGMLPELAERWGRKVRTLYAYTAGALALPPALWDDLADIVAVLGVKVKGRATDGQRPVETPRQFVKRLKKESNGKHRERRTGATDSDSASA